MAMPHPPIVPPPTRQSGFSLMEVLVSIVVLSFGLLGMVGMQAAALQSNREAKLQSSAARYARELAEMMRGNRETGILRTTATNPYLGDFTASNIPTTTVNCYTNAVICNTPKKIGEWEMREWLTRLNNDLPSARVVICFDSLPFVPTTGLPRWNCNDTGDVIMVKIGWTRRSTNTANVGDAAFERAAMPSIVVPVTPGSNS